MAIVLDLVLIGLAIALDPLPLTLFIVVLPSPARGAKGRGIRVRWLVSLAIVVAITVLATGNNPPKSNTVRRTFPVKAEISQSPQRIRGPRTAMAAALVVYDRHLG
jgi:hypothetical protein